MEWVVLLATGAVSGVVAGLVGFAGGIVVVPALTWMYGPAVLADAVIISWFVVFFNSIGAVLKQYRVRSRAQRKELFAVVRPFMFGAALVTPAVAFVIGVSGYLLAVIAAGTASAQHGSLDAGLTLPGMAVLIVSGVLASSLGVHVSRKLPTVALRRVLILALATSAIRLYMT